jgi:hypothetical protein
MPIGKSILDFSIISLFSVAVLEVTYKILMDVSEICHWAVKWKNIDPTIRIAVALLRHPNSSLLPKPFKIKLLTLSQTIRIAVALLRHPNSSLLPKPFKIKLLTLSQTIRIAVALLRHPNYFIQGLPSLCSGIPIVLFYQSLSNDSRCESFGFYHFHQLTKASF